MITLQSYLTLAALLFAIGAMGIIINKKNIIIVMMSIELMLLAVNFNFIAFSYFPPTHTHTHHTTHSVC